MVPKHKPQIGTQQRLDGTVERLPFMVMRHEVERLRIQSQTTGDKFAVISIDCAPTTRRPFSRIVDEIEKLDELLQDGWAHETFVGWLGRDQLAVVLPNASPMDAWQYSEEVRNCCAADENTVRVYANHETVLRISKGQRIQVPSVDELLLKPLPRWKRWLDVVVACVALATAMPFLLVAALLVKLTSKGPVVFSQERVGYGGKPFSIFKLRTMRQDADEIKDDLRSRNEVDGLGFKITDDPRVTIVGRFLRKTSLDELPQLWNVITGDMSLVGPRPLPCSDWHPTNLWMNARHDVRPGLTCTWQIKGRPIRASVSFEEWMMMDIDYIESRDFSMDMRLLVQTVPAVLSQRGAS